MFRLVLMSFFILLSHSLSAEQSIQDSTIEKIEVLTNDMSTNKKIELIKTARKKIWISVMMMDCSDKSIEVYNELLKRQDAGVDVRIISEGFYTKGLLSSCYHWMKDSQLNVISVFDHLRKGSAMDRMMHEKFFIIDDEQVILGGQNFLKYSHESNPNNNYTRDTDVYLKSKRLSQVVQDEFVWLWNFFGKKDILSSRNEIESKVDHYPNKYNCNILVQNKRRYLKQAEDYLLEKFDIAKSLVIISPEVSWQNNSLHHLLQKKLKSGLDFTLIRPGPKTGSNEVNMYFNDKIQEQVEEENFVKAGLDYLLKETVRGLAKKSFQKGLEALVKNNPNTNISVYDYFKYSHTKAYLINNRFAMLGSNNFDMHSFKENYEMAFGCDDERFVTQIQDMIKSDLSKSIKVFESRAR